MLLTAFENVLGSLNHASDAGVYLIVTWLVFCYLFFLQLFLGNLLENIAKQGDTQVISNLEIADDAVEMEQLCEVRPYPSIIQ